MLQELDLDNLSDVSVDDEPIQCGRCEEELNLLLHLENSAACREATMREKLPRQWWIEKYFDNTGLLVFDLSLALRCCLNSAGCPLPRGIIERNSRHPFDNPDCLRFYKTSPVLAQANVDTNNDPALRKYIKNQKRSINRAMVREAEGFSQKMDSQMTSSCQRCGLQGPVLSRFKLAKEVTGEQRMVCAEPVCEDEENHVDYHPRTLAHDRATASNSIEPGNEDNLILVCAPFHAANVLGPAQMVREDCRVPLDEGIDGNKSIVVIVPNTMQAMGKGGLDNPAKRAAEELFNLKPIANATLAPRTMLLDHPGRFVQASSVMYRVMMAAYRKFWWEKTFASQNTARGRLERSPNKTDATFRRPGYRDVAPEAVEKKLPWSDSAEWARLAESEARSAVNGRIRTKVRVRLLADDPALWSKKLKAIMARSFERNITETVEDRQVLTCVGGCDTESCPEVHMQIDEFLKEQTSGIGRLARIPLVLNYLKVKMECFRQAVLISECEHYDFKIKWDRDSWDVYMVGHLWTKKRRSLNEKVARNWYLGDVGIVRRVLQRPEDMETVSLDPQHLESR